MTLLQTIFASLNWQTRVNENFSALSAAGIFGYRAAGSSALTWGYYGGLYNGSTIADGTLTLTDSADNYIVVLRGTGAVSVSTTNTNSVNPLYAKLYKVTCAGGLPTVVVDQRTDTNGLLFLLSGSTGGRETLAANRTYYVRTPAAAVSFTNGSANVTWAAHGRSVNDAVVLSLQPNKGTFTVTIASPAVFTKNAHGYLAGQPLKGSTTGALPTGLTAGTTYYVIATGLTTNTFQVSTTPGGSAVNTSGTQSGTHYIEATGAMPTFSTAGLLAAGTSYFVKTVVDANTLTLSTTAGGTALGTATVATGSPLYIASSGSDTNDGLTAAKGFLTRQRAADVISGTLDLNGYDVTVQQADSTYTAALTLNPIVGTGTATMQGNSTFPANVLVSTTSADAVYATGAGSRWTVKDFRPQTTTSGHCLHTQDFAVLHYGNVDFGPSAGLHVYANTPSTYYCDSNCMVSGAATAHFQADFGGFIIFTGKTLTITGTPTFSSAFAIANTGNMYLQGSTYTGSALGTRYLVSANGVVSSGTTLPGNSTTAPTTGGQFI